LRKKNGRNSISLIDQGKNALILQKRRKKTAIPKGKARENPKKEVFIFLRGSTSVGRGKKEKGVGAWS